MPFKTWKDAAEFCEKTFGVYVDWEMRFFHCPECDESIYFEDWEDHDWSICPVCENAWEDVE